MNYRDVKGIVYVGNCTSLKLPVIEEYLSGSVRANKKEINRLVKIFYPDIYNSLGLNMYNPYDYYRTDRCFILVHSSIEYFFKYKYGECYLY